MPVLVLAGVPAAADRCAPSRTCVRNRRRRGKRSGAVFDALMIVWVFALCVRAVAVALSPRVPGRWWRALVGGLVLIAPIWFASSIAPNDPWWQAAVAREAAPIRAIRIRRPSPCSPRSSTCSTTRSPTSTTSGPTSTDLYFVGFAGDAREDVFRKDVARRAEGDGRALGHRRPVDRAHQQPAHAARSAGGDRDEPARDAERDRRGDRRRAGRRDGLPREPRRAASTCSTSTLPPLELAPLTAPALRSLLDAPGIKWRIVVVSACYSGGFIDALQDDYTLVLTAAARRPRVVRLRHRRRRHVLRRRAVPARARAVANRVLGGVRGGAGAHRRARERRAGSSRRRIRRSIVGPAMAEKLKELDRGNAARRSGPQRLRRICPDAR